jgi:RNA polymerase sigma-70 factor (ECF subfamily)
MQTRASLIFRIRDPQDQLAWSEFVQLYAPLLHTYALKHGLQDADAADLAQDTLRLVLRAAPDFTYDPKRGSFRGWLFTIARNEIRKSATRKLQLAQATGDSDVRAMLNEHPANSADETEWNHEYRRNLFRWAAQRVQPEFRDATWQAFWRTVVDNENIQQVAQQLQLTTGAVYIARSRVTARIRQECQLIDGDAA